MKIPKISNTPISKNEIDDISIIKLEDFGTASFYDIDLNDEKSFIKFIKGIERLVRQSFEYKNYIGYLKNELGIKGCAFFSKIKLDYVKDVTLEFHHYPLTLYDIVSIVLNSKFLDIRDRNIEISPFLIANEVMEAHYENIVGLIPLSSTIHELVHNGKLFIPLSMGFGDVHEFLKRYNHGVTIEQKNSLAILIELTKKFKDIDNETILDKNISYLDIPEFEKMNFVLKDNDKLA